MTHDQIKKRHGFRPQLQYEGQVFVHDKYPNLLFVPPWEIYQLEGKSVLLAGGVYSINKKRRIERGDNWFADEQISETDKQRLGNKLDSVNWRIEMVFSHTCPLRYIPGKAFLEGVDQFKVDKSTELWLDDLETRLCCQKWFYGHFHLDKKRGPIQFLYREILAL